MKLFNFKKFCKHEKIIFFDLGANKGIATRKVIKNFQKKENLIIHMFEPNIRLYDELLEKINKENQSKIKVHIYNNAVYVDGKEYEFLIGAKPDSTNSKFKFISDEWNLSQKKFEGNTTVKAIDISAFIKNHCKSRQGYKCLVKMDIEGAEWDILEKMKNDKTFQFIDCLLIEFHGLDKHKKADSLIKKIKKEFTIDVYKERGILKYELMTYEE